MIFKKGVLGFLRLLMTFAEPGRRVIGEVLEKTGELREIAPLPRRRLKEKGYRRVLALPRLGILAVPHRIRIAGWGRIEEWPPLQHLGANFT